MGDEAGLAVKTKIFISSVAQDDFTRLRQTVFHELRDLGHEPVMYEENLGPWPAHADPVKHCLRAVEASDVFVLFIKDRVGTYKPELQTTVTHLEFLQAFAKKKTILVFVDEAVTTAYFRSVRRRIIDFTEKSQSENGRPPRAGQMLEMLRSEDGLPGHVDPYVWLFVHDLVQRNIYCEPLNAGVGIDWRSYFSDLLRRGTPLLPVAEDLLQSQRLVELYNEYQELSSVLLKELDIRSIRRLDKFLAAFRRKLKGSVIYRRYGEYMEEPIGEILDCSAVTLYKRDGDRMRLEAKEGEAEGEAFYRLDDREAYVSSTYHNRGKERLWFFREDKGLFYCCILVRDYVLTLHFPSDGTWDTQKFVYYNDDINNGIMEKSSMNVELVKTILGGIAHE
ncbi:DUF4062 domain-containing protein [Paenibacillus sp. P25]|nr:DUF4062 domain-containing protein [Paenibacillus sp. P25]